MDPCRIENLIAHRYREVFGATVRPAFSDYLGQGGATLGYRRATATPLFLEAYLGEPVEVASSRALGREVRREAIVEIGNFAVENASTMIELWGAAANDLGGSSEVAVATLTAPLRRTFARIGVPIVELAAADPARVGAGAEWGSYYASDPMVCAGFIAAGQRALAAFQARRPARAAA